MDAKNGVSVYDVEARVREVNRDVGRNQMLLGDYEVID